MENDIIVTYLGEKISLLDIENAKINLEDIAHGLAYTCRFAGQCKSFYNVASHSINCLRVAEYFGYSDELKLYTLLHDASEAYICDIPSPLKKLLLEYKKYENAFQTNIYRTFGLKEMTANGIKQIKEIDNIMFSKEWNALMNSDFEDINTELIIPNLIFSRKNIEEAEEEFLIEAKRLIKRGC